ncbi:GspH/FimT family protein [Lysobacter enzymogenes]|uniref:GspH/FimT family protein n=1 Tax=Lysobacter enzymogenes TaxID=69 RepID=UPI00374A5E38
MRIKTLDAYEFIAAFLLANLLSLLVSPGPSASFHHLSAQSFAQGLAGLYRQAGAHAADTGAPVLLCPVRWIHFRCRDQLDWSRGLMAFADRNRNRAFDSPDELLRRELPLPSHLRLRALRGPVLVRFEAGSGRVLADTPWLLCDLRSDARAWVLRRVGGYGFQVRDAGAADVARCREE